MHLIVPAVIVAVVLLVWFFVNPVIYRGPASVIANNMKHYSKTHRTVMVMRHHAPDTKSDILVATVPNAKAREIAAAAISTRQVTVRQRLFGKPRVTDVS
jgi:hypothetical protein